MESETAAPGTWAAYRLLLERVEVHHHRGKLLSVHCRCCKLRLVVAERHEEASAVALAVRNCEARPCCELWSRP